MRLSWATNAGQRRRRRRVVPVLAVVATALLVGACGGEDGGGEGGGGGDTAVIGVASPLSGEAAVWGEPVVRITKAAVQEINATGGIDGTKLEVVAEDEKFNPEVGVRVVTKLTNSDDAVFITGVTSGTLMATLDFAKRNEVVIASPYSGIVEYDEQGGGDYTYRTVGPDYFDALTVVKNFQEQGFERIGIMSENNDSSLSTSGYVADFAKQMGLEVVSNVTFSAGQSSYIPEVQEAFADDPEAVFLASTIEAAVPIVREWHRRGLGGRWSVLAELTFPEFIEDVGPQIIEGAFGQQTVAATDSEAYEHMAETMKKTYGKEEGKELMNTISSTQDYDTMIIAGLAMVAGGEATSQAINENYQAVGGPPGVKVNSFAEGKTALQAGKEIDYVGASGPLDFNETGTAAPDYGVYQARDGAWEVIQRYSATELYETLESGLDPAAQE